jgi:segregation and condensation protein B
MSEVPETLLRCVEALLMAADGPLSLTQLETLLADDAGAPDRKALRTALAALERTYADSAVALVEVAGGWRLQVREDYAGLIGKLWEERPPRLSRALLETLALICYRQPISRGEIEEVRGVSLSSSIIKTLQEREWIKVVGYREVPGRPALFATTRQLLDDLGLKRLEDLPSLPELRDLDELDGVAADLRGEDAPEEETAEAAMAGDDASPSPPAGDSVH